MTRRGGWRARCAVVLVAPTALVALAGCSQDSPSAGPASQPEAPQPSAVGVTAGTAGEEVVTFEGVPDGYPSKKVPLLSPGKVVSGSTRTYDDVRAFSVVVRTKDQPRSAVRRAVRTLNEAGLRGDTGLPPGTGAPPPRVLHSGGYGLVVTLSAVTSGPGSLVTYTVERS